MVYDGIQLGADETVEVNLEMPPPKTIEHYLLVGRVLGDRAGFLAALRYAARFGPVVGNDVEEARRAAHVTILGGPRGVSLEDERRLRASGCQVRRIGENFAAELERLVQEDASE